MANFVKRGLAAVTVVLALGPSAASAQTGRQIDLSGGYLQISSSMRGANVQLSAELSPRWGLVGEVDWSKGRDCADCSPTFTDVAVLGGVRATWLRERRVSPFAQVLAGVLHSRAGDYQLQYCCGLGTRLQKGYTINYAALQPGGGVTTMLTPRVGIILQGDVQLAVPDQSQYEGMSIFPRIVAGAVIRLGGSR